MARVMVVGGGPLPRPNSNYQVSATLRTRQFVKSLQSAGHTINLFTLPAFNANRPESEVPAMLPDNFEGLAYQRFTSTNSDFAQRALTEQARQLQPDAILAIGLHPAYLAASIPVTAPLWVDYPTPVMAEAQGRCLAENSDEALTEAWGMQRAVLRRLDKYSAVSRPLLQAIIGELGAVGRLNQFTVQYQFGHLIGNAPYRPAEHAPREGRPAEPILRGPIVPGEAFVILWSGGFDTMCDVPTFIAAMNVLMERYTIVHCVLTGGRIDGGPRQPFTQYEELVGHSPYKDRFHQLGWVEAEQLSRIYREADLGISVDGRSYQTMLGARQRLVAMGSEELAVASTIGTELSEWMEDTHALLAAPLGDPQALAEAIEPWIEQREELAVYGRNARRFIEQHLSIERLGQKFLEWTRDCKLAPDNRAKLDLDGGQVQDLNAVTINALEEQSMLLSRFRPNEIQQAMNDWDARNSRSRTRFSFGLRRTN